MWQLRCCKTLPSPTPPKGIRLAMRALFQAGRVRAVPPYLAGEMSRPLSPRKISVLCGSCTLTPEDALRELGEHATEDGKQESAEKHSQLKESSSTTSPKGC